jgi:hypothetical protein
LAATLLVLALASRTALRPLIQRKTIQVATIAMTTTSIFEPIGSSLT